MREKGGGDMRHRSSVAAVESDRGELHLVLSPARSVDTHVIRCVAIARHRPHAFIRWHPRSNTAAARPNPRRDDRVRSPH